MFPYCTHSLIKMIKICCHLVFRYLKTGKFETIHIYSSSTNKEQELTSAHLSSTFLVGVYIPYVLPTHLHLFLMLDLVCMLFGKDTQSFCTSSISKWGFYHKIISSQGRESHFWLTPYTESKQRDDFFRLLMGMTWNLTLIYVFWQYLRERSSLI